MIKQTIKNEIRKIMKISDENPDIDFLSKFGAFRKEVVFRKELVTLDEFDEICEEIVSELDQDQ